MGLAPKGRRKGVRGNGGEFLADCSTEKEYDVNKMVGIRELPISVVRKDSCSARVSSVLQSLTSGRPGRWLR